MTRKELIERIDCGDDFMFDVGDRHLVIFTWCEEGIGVGEQFSEEPLAYFETPDAVVDGYMVDGKPLSERVGEITVTSYTLVKEPPEPWE